MPRPTRLILVALSVLNLTVLLTAAASLDNNNENTSASNCDNEQQQTQTSRSRSKRSVVGINRFRPMQPRLTNLTTTPINQLSYYRVPSMCHIQEHHKPYSKCLGRDEARLSRTAMAEFRSKLEETSSELKQLLETHLAEFRSLSLGVILLARNSTLNKLQLQHQPQEHHHHHHHHNQHHHHQSHQSANGPANWAHSATISATKHLFDAMQRHLLTYPQLVSGSSSDMSFASTPRQMTAGASGDQRSIRVNLDPLDQAISSYFKQLHLIQLKQMLESTLLVSMQSQQNSRSSWLHLNQQQTTTNRQHVLDYQCLEKNLQSQAHVEAVLDELSSYLQSASTLQQRPSSSPTTIDSDDQQQQQQQHFITPASRHLKQARLSMAVKQSLDFARTLLGSLSLSAEMLNNITRRVDEWMPSQACHAALAQMTVCQECHVSGSVSAGVFTSSSVASAASQTLLPPPPCENYCLNVARGCMIDLYELNRFWSDHLNALTRFRTNMIQVNNIENVMSGLDVKLTDFLAKLQAQYGANSNNNNSESNSNNPTKIQDSQAAQAANRLDQLPMSLGLIKLCPQMELAQSPSVADAHQSGGLLSGLWRATLADLNQNQRVGRPATKMLPATQQRPADRFMMETAQRARQSPDLSLFNRLHGLVLQLQSSRNFFNDWPQQVCNRIRRVGGTTSPTSELAGGHQKIPNGSNSNVSLTTTTTTTTTTAGCWNGRDFSGYNKPLAQFGLPISANHPEVAAAQPQPISTSILDLVARLKEVGARLARLSVRQSVLGPLDLVGLKSKLASATTKTAADPAAPSAEAQVSQAGRDHDDLLPAASNINNNQQAMAAKVSAFVSSGQLGGDLDEHEQVVASVVADSESSGAMTGTGGVGSSDGGDDPEAPDGDAAESEGDADDEDEETDSLDGDEGESINSANANSHDDQDDDDEQDLPPCKTDDCSDLVANGALEQGQQQGDLNHESSATTINNNAHGAGSTNAWGETGEHFANNNNVQYHHDRHHDYPSQSSSVNTIATPAVEKYPAHFVNVNNIPQQPANELYPLDSPNPFGGDPSANVQPQYVPSSSSGPSFVMVAQLNGLACVLVLVHLLLAAYTTGTRQHRLVLRLDQ